MAQRQAQVFDAIVHWMRSDRGWDGLHVSDSIFGAHQPSQVEAAARALLEGLDLWSLAAVEQLTYSSKSLLLSLALLHGYLERLTGGVVPSYSPVLSLREGLDASRLEELFQTDEWGEVEAGHDLDKADVGSRVAATLLMLKLLRCS
jgi:ATP synthase F1 complex assembly factor 2